MNFYKHHIGDYAAATAHLSILEDGAYSRLIRLYYRDEGPLPADVKVVQRLAAARSRDEREAIQSVLEEFFELRDDGWHNKRCDAEIAVAHEAEAARDDRRANEAERQRRHRARRQELFEALRAHDIVPAFDTKTDALEAMLSRVTERGGHDEVTDASRVTVTPRHAPATANQKPEARSQKPEERSRALQPTAEESELGSDATQQREQDRCPYQAILALYHELLPMCRHVEKLTDARKGYIRQRWREDLPTLDAWRNFFTDVAASRFLTGRTEGRNGKPPFVADLEWLTRPSNFAKIAEGKYHE